MRGKALGLWSGRQKVSRIKLIRLGSRVKFTICSGTDLQSDFGCHAIMNLAFSTLLHACDPARNHWRAYRVEAGQDLLGDWLVEVTFGRIGPGGRTVRYVAINEADARGLARACLRRRASAPRRIGVAYEERSRFDPNGWTAG